MIPKDDELRVAANTRQLIFDLMDDIEDGHGRRFNDPSPNWKTENRLREFLEAFEEDLVTLGAVRVTAQADCGHPDHSARAVWPINGRSTGHWRYVFEDGSTDFENFDGDLLKYNGTELESDFHAMVSDQDTSNEVCACGRHELSRSHSISRFVAWPKASDSRLGELAMVTLPLRSAIDCSREKRPRSAIREELLLAAIQLEQLIVEETAEEVIKRRLPDFLPIKKQR